MNKCSYVLFDKAPGPKSPGFIKVECEGHSINCGDWEQQPDGLWRLYLNRLPEIERLQEEVKLQTQNVQYRDDIIGLSPGGDRHAHLVDTIKGLAAEVKGLKKDAGQAKVRRIMRQTYLYHCMVLVDFINGEKLPESVGTCEDTIMGDVDRAMEAVKMVRIALVVAREPDEAAEAKG